MKKNLTSSFEIIFQKISREVMEIKINREYLNYPLLRSLRKWSTPYSASKIHVLLRT